MPRPELARADVACGTPHPWSASKTIKFPRGETKEPVKAVWARARLLYSRAVNPARHGVADTRCRGTACACGERGRALLGYTTAHITRTASTVTAVGRGIRAARERRRTSPGVSRPSSSSRKAACGTRPPVAPTSTRRPLERLLGVRRGGLACCQAPASLRLGLLSMRSDVGVKSGLEVRTSQGPPKP